MAGIRKLGDDTIERAGVSLVLEVRRVLARTPTADAIGALHLKNYKLPAASPGDFAVTKIRRTSLRVRNPENAPDAADRAALDRIKDQLERGDPVSEVLVQRVTLPGLPPEWRVYRPIAAMKQCLDCHGKAAALAPGVAVRLKELYPDDAAVDYTQTEWRGLFRVSIADPVARK